MKKYFSGLLAILAAVAASAFTAPSDQPTPTTKYWTYELYGQPGQDEAENLDNPDNYTLTQNNGQTPLVCSGDDHRCGIQAEESGGQPVMSTAQIFLRD